MSTCILLHVRVWRREPKLIRGTEGTGTDFFTHNYWQDSRKRHESETGEVWVQYQEIVLHPEGFWALEQAPWGCGHSTQPDKAQISIWTMLPGTWCDCWGALHMARSWSWLSWWVPSYSAYSMILWFYGKCWISVCLHIQILNLSPWQNHGPCDIARSELINTRLHNTECGQGCDRLCFLLPISLSSTILQALNPSELQKSHS